MSSTIHLLYYSLFISGSTCVCRVTVVWCFQDSQISYQQITKKKKDEGHPASIYPFLPLSSLCNLIPLFIARPCGSLVGLRLLFRVCTLLIFWKHRVIAASVQCIHPLLFPLSIISHLYVLVSGLIIEVVKLIIRLHWLICGCRMVLLWLIFLLWTRVLIWIKKIRF